MSVIVIVIMYLAKNFLFFGVCLYIVALYDELMQQVRHIDDDTDAKADVRPASDRRLNRIVKCIHMHKRIIGWGKREHRTGRN